MIKNLWLDNFKSLTDFSLPLGKFNCLIGLNGAGKSTVLQAIDFISQLMHGRLDTWLESRQWDKKDIKSKLRNAQILSFKLELELANHGTLHWSGHVNLTTLRCTKEIVELAGGSGSEQLLKVEDGHYRVKRSESGNLPESMPIIFEYQGSILSQFKDQLICPSLIELKRFISAIHSLDLLSPELLRTRTKTAQGSLGTGGKNLSAYLHEAGSEKKQHLASTLAKVYEHLQTIETKALRSGWKELEVSEQFDGQLMTSNARHLNDGMLRLMAILSNLTTAQQFLLFDEIENGINPELIQFLLQQLQSSTQQVVLTTHSPLILNYLETSVAKQGVVYLYKSANGATKAIPFFTIPSLAEKLTIMGPGEAFIDTHLFDLQKEIDEVIANRATAR